MDQAVIRTLPASAADFSVYRQIRYPSVMNIFTEKPRVLAFWSHRIERAIVDYNLDTHVYVAFQHLSRFAPVVPQYQRMSAVVRSLWVFGENDRLEGKPAVENYPVMPRVTYVDLPENAALRQEWFVVVSHPMYARALLAEEITPPGTPQEERLFRGISTSDVPIIQEIQHVLAQITVQLA